MKKIRLLLLCVMGIFTMLLFASCGFSNTDGSSDDTSSSSMEDSSVFCTTHTWEGGYVSLNPTCTREGEYTHLCTVCGATKSEILPRLEHSFADTWTKDEKYHWHAATCNCINDKIDKAEHTWGEGWVFISPNCYQYGSRIFNCTVCGAGKSEDIPPLKHTFEEEWTSDENYHWHAATCGCDDQRGERAKHDWDNGEVTKPATCKEEGICIYSCVVCFEEKTEEIPISNEHVWSDDVMVTEPTCTAEGYTTHTCSVCGDSYQDTPVEKKPHTYNSVVNEPTCKAEGYTMHTCSVCGDSYQDSIVEKKPHTYKETVFEPTCKTGGYTKYTCTACGSSYLDHFVGVKPHAYVDTVIEPTCDRWGYTIHTCADCGDSYKDTYTDETDNHTYKMTIEEATCTSGKYEIYTCEICGYIMTVNISNRLPHNYQTVVVPPTCTSVGYTEYTCTTCDYHQITDYINSIPHNFVNIFCTECGKQEYSIGLSYQLSDDGNYYIIKGMGTCRDKQLVVPQKHEGIPVLEIAASAFEGNARITSIIFLAEDIEQTIGSRAFFGCSALTEIKLSAGIAEIDEGAFANCGVLENIFVDKENEWYHSVSNCLIEKETKTLILGCMNSVIPIDGKVTMIGSYAFYGCVSLLSITIPESVNFIGMYAFTDCEPLEEAIFLSNDNWYTTKTLSAALDKTYGISINVDWSSASASYLYAYDEWYWFQKPSE